MMLLAAGMAFLVVWLCWPPDLRARLKGHPAHRSAAGSRQWPRGLVVALGVLSVVLAGWFAAGAGGAAIGFAAVLPVVTAGQLWRRHYHRVSRRRQAEAVAAACQQLAGLIRVGHVPAAALVAAARDAPALTAAAAAQLVGGSVSEALRRLGSGGGAAGFVELGVAWEVAEKSGASLTTTLDTLAERLVAAQGLRAVVAAELAAPRATGRMLAVLPAAGLALGYGFGGDPVAFLLGTPAGQASLALGVGLACAGVFWTERLADAAGG